MSDRDRRPQTPAGDIPIRSVTLASDGSLLVAGNNKARFFLSDIAVLLTDALEGTLLCLEGQRRSTTGTLSAGDEVRGAQQIPHEVSVESRCEVRGSSSSVFLFAEFGRGQVSRDVLSRHDGEGLVHLTKLRIPTGEGARRTSTLGVGLCVQRGLCIPGDGCAPLTRFLATL